METGLDSYLRRLSWLKPNLARIAGVTVAATGIFTALAFIARPWYEAQISVVPVSRNQGALSALAAELPFDVGGNTGTDAERIVAVFKSRSVTDSVITKFRLQDRYHEKYLEFTRTEVWKHCRTKLDKKPSVVTLTCEDTDPHVAQEMAAYFGEVGNEAFRRISVSSATEERRFLERRWAEAKKDVVDASTRLREFEEKHKLVDLGEQSKAVVSAIATLKGELLSKQMQLSYLNSFSSSDESTAAQLRRQVSIMEAKLKQLEEDSSANNEDEPQLPAVPTARNQKRPREDRGLFPGAMSVPKLRFELEQLAREKKVQETLFVLLTQRYETARIDEARDTSAFQILDAPVMPTRKSRPKRANFMIGGFILGLLLGLGWSFVRRPRPAALSPTSV
jgi:tyrosine-protein kinase Etk/Wzc